jgi:hypothetical protein
MRQILVVLTWLTLCAPALAQKAEVGMGIGRGCAGAEGGFCGDDIGAMWSAHASVWIEDRLEIGVRIATLPLPDRTYSVPRDDRFNKASDLAIRQLSRVDVAVWDRSRQLLSAEASYHFAPGRPVRGFLGAGLGDRNDRFEQACVPSGCEALMPILSSPVGQRSIHGGNLTAIAGVSGRIRKALQVRVGIRLHNLASEGLSTTEIFIATGYRFGRD